MKKLKCFLGKRKEELFGCNITAGARARGMRPGRSGLSPAAPKRFGRAARRVPSPSGRSMVEMLAVLAIIGVLSVAALAGLTYAVNKHRANTIYNDVHLLALHVMDTGKDTVPADFYPDSGKTFTLDTTTYADGFVVKVAAVSEKVCDRIMEVNDPSIEKIYVGSEEATTCSGTQTIGFMFLYDGTFTSGGSSCGSGSGSGTEPDLCADVLCGGCQSCDSADGQCKDNDANCSNGQTCSNGTCVCTDDSQCGLDEICQNGLCETVMTCSSNTDCVSDTKFCAFEETTSCSDKGEGKCLLISDYGISDSVDGFTYSMNNMKWWSAQNWCLAQGKRPVTRADIGCDVSGTFCTSSIALSFASLGHVAYVWLEDYGNSCHAHRIGLNNGHLLETGRMNRSPALCY